MKKYTWRDNCPDYIIGCDIFSNEDVKSIAVAATVKRMSDGTFVATYKIETTEGPEAVEKIIDGIASSYKGNVLTLKEGK